ncbi:MAG: Spy/CpxP family protein refolding chaperone [Methylovirgula sp.]
MPGPKQRLLSATTALCLALSLATEAYAFGHGGGGGHFGGGHFGGGHFGHFGGYHFGGGHYGYHFGHAHYAHAHHFGGHQHFAHGVGRGMVARHAFAHGFDHGGWAGHGGYWHNHYGYGWGWGGPVFWPYYYDDALFFALWPDDYYDPFFDYGPDALFAGLFWPGYSDSGYGAYSGAYWSGNLYAEAPPSQHRRRGRHQQTQQPEAQANATDACAAKSPDVAALPIDRIAKAIQPSADQTNLLNDLKDAETKAGDVLHAACPSQVPLTPVARFDAIEQRLTATQQAIDLIRTPLARLYDSLGDAQKAKFDAIALGRRHRPSKAKGQPAAVALCKERSQQFTGLPAQQIADTLKPTQEQKAAFDALKTAADEATATVAAACPNVAPQNVTERFDAIDARLNATIAAIKTVEPKLKAFYATLTDEQKAQFNLLSPPNTTDRG